MRIRPEQSHGPDWMAMLLTFALTCTGGVAATFDHEIEPTKQDNFDKAAFRLWIDDGDEPVEGIVSVALGINGDSRPEVESAVWQDFARKHRLAVVGVFLRSPENALIQYGRAERGSGAAYVTALNALAEKSKHPEIATVPLLMWGHSAGGMFNFGFACYAPERVWAFAAIKSGIFESPISDEARAVPGLFIVGERDREFRILAANKVVFENRKRGARWCLAVEANVGHAISKANELILPFFEAVLQAGDRGKHRPEGFAVDLDKRIVIPAGKPPKSVRYSVWFPAESFGIPWKTFIAKPRPQ
jgi:hypothetical protein